MSRHQIWRCPCSREVGEIRWRLSRSVLKLARSVDEVLLGPGTAAAICPTCGTPVYFESRESGFVTTMLTTSAAAS